MYLETNYSSKKGEGRTSHLLHQNGGLEAGEYQRGCQLAVLVGETLLVEKEEIQHLNGISD